MANKCAVILAGGEGKRMKSDKPKTLSEVMDKPMLQWVIDAIRKSGVENICVVKGYKKECIEEYLTTLEYKVSSVFQAERLGTGHAVMMAKNFLIENDGDVIILNGDAPFMDSETIQKAYDQHIATNSSATVISARVENPTGYGRIVREENGSLKAIVEQKDADEETLAINEVNSGGFWFNTSDLLSVLDNIQANNAAKEYYLPDALKLLLANGKAVGAFTAESADTVLGANDPAQLADLNAIAYSKYGKYPY
ncbi:MAG: sugar phosphate nucleotidyltransferase [Acutalibacteraceae bacterium]|nr:sugar phosphate nucleotidyltransferase [Acutalibacteraceae bacterium]